jgi:hypothetical protein
MSQHSQHQPHMDDASHYVFPIFKLYDMYQKVVEFLNPKELHNLTLSCKASRDNLTTPIVIKNALLNGNKHAKTSIERVYAQVLANTILVPTAIRLLSLLTMKYCECCNIKAINFVSDYGLALCLSCKKEHTSRIEMKPAKLLRSELEMNDIIQHKDVNLILHHFVKEQPNLGYYSRRIPVYYVLDRPFFDENNKRVGPTITKSHLNEMLNLSCYHAVEKYIKNNKTTQTRARRKFIHAMTLNRESCYTISQIKENNKIVKAKRYRYNKYINTRQAIAFLLERIPENIRYKLDYRVHLSFPGPPALTRPQLVPLHRSNHHYLLLACDEDNVRAILAEGPPDGKVYINIVDRVVDRIVKPLLCCPTKFNDETKTRHEENLHQLAQTICRYYGARGDNDFPATW